MADEWATLVKQLWHSWQPDAVVADETTRTYVDHRKVRTVDFEGRHHRSRGPLNTLPSPQGHPVLCQAGGSPAGRDFGAKHADLIVSAVRGVDAMRSYRRDIDARMLEHSRKPDEAKVLYLVAPILGETAEDAEELRRRRDAATEQTMQDNLFWMSYYSGVDFAQFDLDAPMPDISAQNNGHRSTMADYAAAGAGKTLRELAGTHRTTASVELVGTPDAVAAQMGEIADDAGADGFLLTGEMSRRAFAAVADGLAPELRKRGLIRDGYSGSTFRENLLAF
jgi:alkanesulfonate monooxygenase SsuD/methylene tetrahydromethanopterin reductase-like flavin-dependent oxidoreductase (luciferase family)